MSNPTDFFVNFALARRLIKYIIRILETSTVERTNHVSKLFLLKRYLFIKELTVK